MEKNAITADSNLLFIFNPRDSKKQSAITMATTQRGVRDTEALGHIPNLTSLSYSFSIATGY